MSDEQQTLGDDSQLGIREQSLLAHGRKELCSHELDIITLERRIHYAIRKDRPTRVEHCARCVKPEDSPVVLCLDRYDNDGFVCGAYVVVDGDDLWCLLGVG